MRNEKRKARGSCGNNQPARLSSDQHKRSLDKEHYATSDELMDKYQPLIREEGKMPLVTTIDPDSGDDSQIRKKPAHHRRDVFHAWMLDGAEYIGVIGQNVLMD